MLEVERQAVEHDQRNAQLDHEVFKRDQGGGSQEELAERGRGVGRESDDNRGPWLEEEEGVPRPAVCQRCDGVGEAGVDHVLCAGAIERVEREREVELEPRVEAEGEGLAERAPPGERGALQLADSDLRKVVVYGGEDECDFRALDQALGDLCHGRAKHLGLDVADEVELADEKLGPLLLVVEGNDESVEDAAKGREDPGDGLCDAPIDDKRDGERGEGRRVETVARAREKQAACHRELKERGEQVGGREEDGEEGRLKPKGLLPAQPCRAHGVEPQVHSLSLTPLAPLTPQRCGRIFASPVLLLALLAHPRVARVVPSAPHRLLPVPTVALPPITSRRRPSARHRSFSCLSLSTRIHKCCLVPKRRVGQKRNSHQQSSVISHSCHHRPLARPTVPQLQTKTTVTHSDGLTPFDFA